MEKQNFFSKYKSIVAFLILEVLALLSFTFANIDEIFFFVGFVISLLAFVFSFFTNNDKKDYIKLIPPLVILIFISALAGFGGLSNSFTSFSNLAVFFGIPSFFALGFFIRRLGEIKIEHVLLAIGFGLALLVLIGTFATWVQYGPFYSLIYKVKGTTNYYYDGAPYDVTKEMSWLFGFEIKEGSIDYCGTFAVITAAFLPSILFIKRSENRNMFISSAVIGGIGLISLLTVPNFKGLGVIAAAFVLCLVYKFLKGKKVSTIIGYAFIGFIALGVLFFLVAIINASAGFAFKGFLNRIFVENRIMKNPSEVLKAAFDKTIDGKPYNLFGFDLTNSPAAFLINLNDTVCLNTGIFEIQLVKEIGVIGAIVAVLALCSMIYFVAKYLKEENDVDFIKMIIVSILLAYFAYESIANDINVLIHGSDYGAFLRSTPFMISLVLLGLIYFVPPKKEEVK